MITNDFIARVMQDTVAACYRDAADRANDFADELEATGIAHLVGGPEAVRLLANCFRRVSEKISRETQGQPE